MVSSNLNASPSGPRVKSSVQPTRSNGSVPLGASTMPSTEMYSVTTILPMVALLSSVGALAAPCVCQLRLASRRSLIGRGSECGRGSPWREPTIQRPRACALPVSRVSRRRQLSRRRRGATAVSGDPCPLAAKRPPNLSLHDPDQIGATVERSPRNRRRGYTHMPKPVRLVLVALVALLALPA